MTATNQTGSPATSLTVKWQQNKAQPAKSARYSLYRYRTGQTDTNRDSVCAGANSVEITADQLNDQNNGITVDGSDLQYTTSTFCNGVANLQSGR